MPPAPPATLELVLLVTAPVLDEVVVLDEVERPVRMAVAIARGVRSGTTTLLQRFTRRHDNGGAPQRGNEP